MQYLKTLKLSLFFGVILLLAVACGSSAPAEQTSPPADTGTSASSAPAAAEPAAPASAAPAAAAPASGAPAAAAPTAVPAPAAMPAMESTEVHPGKVTWMVGSFANERMTYCLAGGGGHDYGRQIHAFLIDSQLEGGARVLTPGIAEKWEVTP